MSKKAASSGSTSLSFPLFILYGSATGNAEYIAKNLTKQFETNYALEVQEQGGSTMFDGVICGPLDQFKKVLLPYIETPPSNPFFTKYGLLIIASTTGNGESPENCSRFVRYLKNKRTCPELLFQHVQYSVLGLGDTNYDLFCSNGKSIDKKINDLHGSRVLPIACADEGTGLEDVVDPWTDRILKDMIKACCQTNNTNNTNGENKNGENKNGTTTTTTSDDSTKTNNTAITTTTTTTTTDNNNNVSTSSGTSNNKENVVTSTPVDENVEITPSTPPLSTTTITTTTTSTSIPSHTTNDDVRSTITNDHTIPNFLFNNNNNNKDESLSSSSSKSSLGVKLVRTLFLQQLQKEKQIMEQKDEMEILNTEFDSLHFSTTTSSIPTTTTITTGTTTTTSSSSDTTFNINNNKKQSTPFPTVSITYVNDHDHDNINSTGSNLIRDSFQRTDDTVDSDTSGMGMGVGEIEEVEDDMIASSTRIYYSMECPYVSTIQNARYLTKQTTYQAAQDITNDILLVVPTTTTTTTASSSSSSSSSSVLLVPPTMEANVTTTTTTDKNGSSSRPILSANQWTQACGIIEKTFPYNHHTTKEDTVVVNEKNGKRVIELTLSLPNNHNNHTNDKPFYYQPGDSIGLLMDNTPDVVQLVLDILKTNQNLNPNQKIRINKNNNNNNTIHDNGDPSSTKSTSPKTITEILRTRIDLCCHLKVSHVQHRTIFLRLSELLRTKLLVIDNNNNNNNNNNGSSSTSTNVTSKLSDEEIVQLREEAIALQILGCSSSSSSSKKSSTKSLLSYYGKILFDQIIEQQCCTFLDVIIKLFPSTVSCITLEFLLSHLPQCMTPRYYSVASSPLVMEDVRSSTEKTKNKDGSKRHQPTSLTIAFSVVDYVTPSLIVGIDQSANNENHNAGIEFGQRRIHGLATTYLEIMASTLLCSSASSLSSSTVSCCSDSMELLPQVRIFPKPSTDFHLPKSQKTPMILIGPGTGIAPFIGFLQHRQVEKSQQKEEDDVTTTTLDNKTNEGTSREGSIDVYFGCRHRDHDWLYEKELQSMHHDGIITQLHTTFSRDNNKVTKDTVDVDVTVCCDRYVQDRMKKNDCCERLTRLIVEQQAVVYVCGDGNQMAKDVQKTFVELLASSPLSLLLQPSPGTNNNNNDDDDNNSNNNLTTDPIVPTDRLSLAQQYLDHMKINHRFLLDIWS